MKKLPLLCLFVVACLIAGCGYTTSSSLPGNLKTVYVEPFKNEIDFTTERRRNIYFPLLEVDVRNAIVNRLQFDGNLRIADADSADLILKGKLVGYRRHALRFEDDDDVLEYRVQIVMDLVLMDTSLGEPMWEEKGFVGEADYFVTGSQASSESSAVADATVDLARRIVERTIENW